MILGLSSFLIHFICKDTNQEGLQEIW